MSLPPVFLLCPHDLQGPEDLALVSPPSILFEMPSQVSLAMSVLSLYDEEAGVKQSTKCSLLTARNLDFTVIFLLPMCDVPSQRSSINSRFLCVFFS